MRNKEVADAFGISEKTARVHVKKLFENSMSTVVLAAMNAAIPRGIIHIHLITVRIFGPDPIRWTG